jgi:hypothetical protein
VRDFQTGVDRIDLFDFGASLTDPAQARDRRTD